MVKPDAAFVREDRLPPQGERDGVYRFAPDLAVEVVSPTDRYVDVMEKVELYLDAGVPLVWLIESRRQSVTVFAGRAEPHRLTDADILDGSDVLPDFRLPVRQIFR
jgi:Uma2 family endonuclease